MVPGYAKRILEKENIGISEIAISSLTRSIE